MNSTANSASRDILNNNNTYDQFEDSDDSSNSKNKKSFQKPTTKGG